MAAGSSAEIGIRVFLDDAASGGLGNLNKQLNGIGANALTAGGAFRQMSAEMAGMSVLGGFTASLGLLFAGLKYSVDSAAQFQQAMFGVAVATHVSMDAAMKYAPTVMQLGSTSNYTSAQIADGIAQLGRANYSIAQIMDPIRQIGADYKTTGGVVVQVSSSMAQAALDLGVAIRGTAADGFGMLAQTMAAYHAPANQAMLDADLLQFAFEHQRSSVASFTSGLSQVTPTAGYLGLSLKEVLAALDTIGPAMQDTSMAGTALRYTMAGLYQPNATQQTEMIKLKLATIDAGGAFHSAFYDSKGNVVDFSTALQILNDKLKGMNQAAKENALRALFSIKGGQGAGVLLGDLEKYNSLVNQQTATNNNAGGVMTRMQQQQQNLAFEMAALKTSVTDLGVAVGLILIPYVTKAANWLNTNFVSALRNVVMAAPQAGQAILTFIKFAAGISGLGIAATIVGLAIAGMVPPILVVAGVVGGVVLGVGLLAAGLTYLSMHANIVKAALNELRSILSLVMGVVVGLAGGGGVIALIGPFMRASAAIKQFFSIPGDWHDIINAMSQAATAMGKGMTAAIQWTISTARMIPTMIAEIGTNIARAAAWTLANLPIIIFVGLAILVVLALAVVIQHFGGLHILLVAGQAIWRMLLPILQQIATQIRGALAQAVQTLMPVWNQLVAAFRQAQPALLQIGMVIGGVLVVAVGIAVGIFLGLVRAIGAVLVAAIRIVAGIIQIFGGLVQFFIGFAMVLGGLLVALFTGNWSLVLAGLNLMKNGVINVFTGMWNAVKAVFVGAWDVLVGFVGGFIQGIIGFFTHMSTVLVGRSIIPDMMNAIKSVIQSVLIAVLAVIIQFVFNTIAHFLQMGAQVVAAAVAAWAMFRLAIQVALAAAIVFVSSGVSNMISRVTSFGAQLMSTGQSAWNNFSNTIQNGINNAVSFVSGLPGRVAGALAGLGTMLFNSGATAMQMFANGLTSAIGAVTNAVGNAAGTVRDFLQHLSPAKMGPLANDDKWMPNMMKMFAAGIEQHTPLVQSAASRAAGGIASAPSTARMTAPTPGYGSAGMNGGTTTVNLVLDGTVLGTAVINHLTGQMQLNGLGRAFR